MNRSETGTFGERLAADYYRSRGYRILARNYRCPQGELDLVCGKQGHLYAVEVKTRRSNFFGFPEEAVTEAKNQRIRLSIEHFMNNLGHNSKWKSINIEVFSIEIGETQIRIRIYKNT